MKFYSLCLALLIMCLSCVLCVGCAQEVKDQEDNAKLPTTDSTAASSDVDEAHEGAEGEPAPGLIYQGVFYRMPHEDGNRIDVTDLELQYIGETKEAKHFVEDLDCTADGMHSSKVYTAASREGELIYHCSHCGEYFSILPDQEQPTSNEGDSSAQEVAPVEVMDPRPSLYYQGTVYDLKHYDGNKIDVTDFTLKYIGDMNYVGIKMSHDLDTNDDSTKGSAVYTAKEQLVGLIYHCSHCGEYFSILPE